MNTNFKRLLILALGIFCTGAFAGWSNTTVAEVRVVKADDGREMCIFIDGGSTSHGFEIESVGDAKMVDLLMDAHKSSASIWFYDPGTTQSFNLGGSSYYTTVYTASAVTLP